MQYRRHCLKISTRKVKLQCANFSVPHLTQAPYLMTALGKEQDILFQSHSINTLTTLTTVEMFTYGEEHSNCGWKSLV